MIERFLPGLDALLDDPEVAEPIAVVFPGDMDPFDRHYRFGVFLDADLRLAGLGNCGGGGSVQALDDEDEWQTAYVILDTELTEMDAGRALLREHLPELGCPVGTLIQFGDHEDRWDGERWHLADPRTFDEDVLPCRGED